MSAMTWLSPLNGKSLPDISELARDASDLAGFGPTCLAFWFERAGTNVKHCKECHRARVGMICVRKKLMHIYKVMRQFAVITLGCPDHLPLSGSHEKTRSEEHTSELQSRENLVCRLLLEKKKLMLIIICYNL